MSDHSAIEWTELLCTRKPLVNSGSSLSLTTIRGCLGGEFAMSAATRCPLACWRPQVPPSLASGDLEQAQFPHPLSEDGPLGVRGIGGQPVLVVARVGDVAVGLVTVGDDALEEVLEPLGLLGRVRVLGVADRPLAAVGAVDAGMVGVPVEGDDITRLGLGDVAGDPAELASQALGVQGRVAPLPALQAGGEVGVCEPGMRRSARSWR